MPEDGKEYGTMKAEFVRDLPNTLGGAKQKLWRVGDEYIVSSAGTNPVETYVFKADEDGLIVDYCELLGSFRGALDHDRAIAGYVESLKTAQPKQPSDPKHLPPRDCLVLIECPDGYSAEPVFLHVLFEEESGDYDEEGRIHGHADRWMDAVEGEEIDPSRVITWRELPEVE